ncbi:hypothetical protein PORY_001990 [Pneumocystis oryctolagi]|uniref:Uncharacterized protein n=1 Tax=Pneumocystis oryctolagi TaxID=42067 RepID=A0ACB7CC01_9ASCO|nr:hypothetical protein PORY_001990 [Pneumocystis oryctolagi]
MSSKEYVGLFSSVFFIGDYENKSYNNQYYTQPPPQYPQQSYNPHCPQSTHPCPQPCSQGQYYNGYCPQMQQQQPVYVHPPPKSVSPATGCLAW